MVPGGCEKIMPQEVDRALAAHPAVADAAAFRVPHATLGEDGMAAVVLRFWQLAAVLAIYTEG
jgi:acyl-CoA synthetase (AMP-forming)/AMP-acid ligase II